MSLVEWGESWARSRGFWHGAQDPVDEDSRTARFEVAIFDGKFMVQETRLGDDGHRYQMRGEFPWTLSPAEFYLFALAHDSGRSARRVCPDCEGSREQSKRDGRVGEPGWTLRLSAKALVVELWRPCPKCDALGNIDTQLTRVVCEAMPVSNACPHEDTIQGHCIDCQDTGYNGGGPEWLPGSPAARTELLQAAYGLLVGWTDGERAKRGAEDSNLQPIEQPCTVARGRPASESGGLPGSSRAVQDRPALTMFMDARLSSEPSSAAVLRDYLAHEHGVRVAPDRTLALTSDLAQASGCKPDGELGAALMVWLGGEPCGACDRECDACGWHGRYGHKTGCTVSDSTGPCEGCHGEGTALAAHAVAQASPARAPAVDQVGSLSA